MTGARIPVYNGRGGRNPLILVFDIGTTYVKGGIVDTDGRVLAKARAPVRCTESAGGEGHESDPNSWISGIGLVSAQLSLRDRRGISGVVVSSNGPTLVPVGADGEPLDFAMTWMDRRPAEEARMVSEASGTPVDASFFLPKALWIARHKADVYRRARWLLPCAEYVTFRLTGEAFRVAANKPYREIFWQESAAAKAGVDAGKLPPFAETGDPVGVVGEAASQVMGIPAGLPVYAAGADFLMAILGTAATTVGRACDRAGTSEGINLCWGMPAGDRRLHSAPHIVPGRFNVVGTFSTSGLGLDWLASVVGVPKDYAALFSAMEAVPAGSRGLLFLPFLRPERFPLWDPDGKGAFLGLTTRHGRAELAKAVVESGGFAARRILELMEASGCAAGELRVTGGLARHPSWCQMRADITGKRILLPEEEEAELVGDACVGFTAEGRFHSLAEAADCCVRIKRHFIPRSENREVYEGMYRAFRAALTDLGGTVALPGG